MEGPVDLEALQHKKPPSAAEMVTPITPPLIVSGGNQPQIFLMATPARLAEKSQLVRLHNHDRFVTHIMIDRYMIGHELAPGETKELDMTIGDIEAHREKYRPNRGVYRSGHLAGRPLPPHPVRFVDLVMPESAGVDDGGGGDNLVPQSAITAETPIERAPPPAPEPQRAQERHGRR
jgi:hypothetical protein